MERGADRCPASASGEYRLRTKFTGRREPYCVVWSEPVSYTHLDVYKRQVFEILLFAYSADFGPVEVIDLTQNETIPAQIIAALNDPCAVSYTHLDVYKRQNLSQESISTGRFGTSMSAHHILGLQSVPRVGLFAHYSGT